MIRLSWGARGGVIKSIVQDTKALASWHAHIHDLAAELGRGVEARDLRDSWLAAGEPYAGEAIRADDLGQMKRLADDFAFSAELLRKGGWARLEEAVPERRHTERSRFPLVPTLHVSLKPASFRLRAAPEWYRLLRLGLIFVMLEAGATATKLRLPLAVASAALGALKLLLNWPTLSAAIVAAVGSALAALAAAWAGN